MLFVLLDKKKKELKHIMEGERSHSGQIHLFLTQLAK